MKIDEDRLSVMKKEEYQLIIIIRFIANNILLK